MAGGLHQTAGERGVDHVLGLLAADVRRTMALVGAARMRDLSRDLAPGARDLAPVSPRVQGPERPTVSSANPHGRINAWSRP